jgi:hypothetical protein
MFDFLFNLFEPKRKSRDRISSIQIGGSNNSQVSISRGNNVSIINTNGNVSIIGNIKTLTINGKKIEL